MSDNFVQDAIAELMILCLDRGTDPSSSPDLVAEVMERRFKIVAAAERAKVTPLLRLLKACLEAQAKGWPLPEKVDAATLAAERLWRGDHAQPEPERREDSDA